MAPGVRILDRSGLFDPDDLQDYMLSRARTPAEGALVLLRRLRWEAPRARAPPPHDPHGALADVGGGEPGGIGEVFLRPSTLQADTLDGLAEDVRLALAGHA